MDISHRRRGQARRQEGQGSDHRGRRRYRLGGAALAGRRGRTAADRRGGGRAADAREAPDREEDRRGGGLSTMKPRTLTSKRMRTRAVEAGRRKQRRARDVEEAHPARLARRKEPEEEAAGHDGHANGAEPAPNWCRTPNRCQDTSEEPAGPVIHLPDREIGDGGERRRFLAVKKRTRRGSRGGKNRRKKLGRGDGDRHARGRPGDRGRRDGGRARAGTPTPRSSRRWPTSRSPTSSRNREKPAAAENGEQTTGATRR